MRSDDTKRQPKRSSRALDAHGRGLSKPLTLSIVPLCKCGTYGYDGCHRLRLN